MRLGFEPNIRPAGWADQLDSSEALDRGDGLMQRRDLLGAIALPALPAPDSEPEDTSEPEDDSGEFESKTRRVLEDAPAFAEIECYESGAVTVRPLSYPPGGHVVEMTILADWGEAGVALTAEEALALTQELFDAIERAEKMRNE